MVKWFNAVYYVKVHCPLCKEKILAKAVKCPHCKTNFNVGSYQKRLVWQENVKKGLGLLSFGAGLVIGLSGVGLIAAPFVAVLIYGVGYFLIHKVQSIKNFHYKP